MPKRPGKKMPALSPAETEVLRILWQLGSGTVQQVRDDLPAGRKITYATVQTLLRRLEAKGYLKHKSAGRAHVFSPAIKASDVIRRTVGDFVERLYGGDPVPLMMHLADSAALNAADIERLKNLINKAR